LYAKALALLGLGMLAGTGALVDYWPVAEPLPSTASVRVKPSTPAPVPSGVVERAEPESAVVTPMPAPATLPTLRKPAMSSEVTLVPEPPPTEALRVTTVAQVVLGTPYGGLQAPGPEPIGVPAHADDSPRADEYPAVRTTLASSSADVSGEGLITGAFKKTGSSLVRTGARTGASIFDAVRVVSGVVRRALPTN
jgi:hypothetical protein